MNQRINSKCFRINLWEVEQERDGFIIKCNLFDGKVFHAEDEGSGLFLRFSDIEEANKRAVEFNDDINLRADVEVSEWMKQCGIGEPRLVAALQSLMFSGRTETFIYDMKRIIAKYIITRDIGLEGLKILFKDGAVDGND